MTVIPVVIGIFETVPKCLVKGREDLEIIGQMKIIQSTVIFWPSTQPQKCYS